ncbi:MAG: ArsA family ATPase [Acidimicrobiales bacterium]
MVDASLNDAQVDDAGLGLSPQQLASVDSLLANADILIMAGPGGVGKTTIGAALGVRAAQVHERRVVVVTVDPARRLAEALGVARITEEPVLVPVGGGDGRLWMLMVDMAKSWDQLVARHSPTPEVADKLLANSLYRTLTRRFVQSHDYIAFDHLLSLAEADRYDLVIVDTPPSDHALDLLDAPGRMIEFFESRLLRWLSIGAGSSLTTLAAKPFLLVAERLLGSDFLGQITEFFTLFSRLRPRFVARARAVEERLSDDSTTYVVVTTTDPLVAAGAQELTDELDRRGLTPGMLVANRFAPTLRLDDDGIIASRFDDGIAGEIEDPTLSQAVAQLLDQARVATLPSNEGRSPVVAVAWSAADLTDLDGLAGLLSSTPAD